MKCSRDREKGEGWGRERVMGQIRRRGEGRKRKDAKWEKGEGRGRVEGGRERGSWEPAACG